MGAPRASYMAKTDKERLVTGFWNCIESNQATGCNIVIRIILLGVYASRRQRHKLETLPEKEDMHAYLQWKAELEAGQAKHEMKVEEKRFEMEGDNVRAEMSEAGDDRLVLRSLQERHELSGEEVSKELDIQSEG